MIDLDKTNKVKVLNAALAFFNDIRTSEVYERQDRLRAKLVVDDLGPELTELNIDEKHWPVYLPKPDKDHKWPDFYHEVLLHGFVHGWTLWREWQKLNHWASDEANGRIHRRAQATGDERDHERGVIDQLRRAKAAGLPDD